MAANSKKNATGIVVEMIPTTQLYYDDDGGRSFDDIEAKRLAYSVARYGFCIPLVVRKTKKGYEILDGRTRYDLFKDEMNEFPCVVVNADNHISRFLLNTHGEFDFSVIANYVVEAMVAEKRSLEYMAKALGWHSEILRDVLSSLGLLE